MAKDLFIVRCNKMLTTGDTEKLHKNICDMVESGVVLLPRFCDVLLAPGDVDVVFEEVDIPCWKDNK